jgi:hypothetical protein
VSEVSVLDGRTLTERREERVEQISTRNAVFRALDGGTQNRSRVALTHLDPTASRRVEPRRTSIGWKVLIACVVAWACDSPDGADLFAPIGAGGRPLGELRPPSDAGWSGVESGDASPEIDAGADAGALDAAATDAGKTGTGEPPDAGADAAQADAGSVDAGLPDAGVELAACSGVELLGFCLGDD